MSKALPVFAWSVLAVHLGLASVGALAMVSGPVLTDTPQLTLRPLPEGPHDIRMS